MKLIPLTHGLFAKVDDEDYEMLNAHKWHRHGAKRRYYARAHVGHDELGKQILKLMHHLVLPGHSLIDHINHDGLDNQKHNLRPATARENCRNKESHLNTTSIHKGVAFHASSGRWQATITDNGVFHYLGLFDDEQDAALAYNNEAIKRFGEFACLNVLDRDVFKVGAHKREVRFGETHPLAKLTEDDVLDIRSIYAFGARLCDISAAYNIGTSQARRIATGQSWKHV